MSNTLWHNATIATPAGLLQDGYVLVDDNGVILEVGMFGDGRLLPPRARVSQTKDLQGALLLPGLIDVHVHGGGGFETMAGTAEHLDGMSRFHAEHGTTSFLATLMTDDPDRIGGVLEATADTTLSGVSGAELLGSHLEGPFLNAKRAGAQSKSFIRNPDARMIDCFLAAARGTMRLATLAPELPGGLAAVSAFAAAGVTVSAGHTDATFAEMEEAVRHGVSHTTHHFNGMRPFHHREPGAAGAGLLLPELTVELIADGIHCHPEAIRLTFLTKPASRICMITDAMLCAGLPDGEYGDSVMENGQIYSRDRSTLAGSSLTMIAALRNTMRFTGLTVEQVLPSFTSVPARQAGADGRKGTLEAGKDADMIVVDDRYELLMTVVRGRTIVDRNAHI
ncbi:N-acetylglucosamine-6-phosphate deacetylase [Paenibacillus sp. MY03]|uniref:N-acetylglucosamine-6-phosphate deacetylase n=1 Tax=Paenibacillus sp. MY03 TaxID=302980 RepID=UPI000B3D1FD2|nr:N-acetylglucosamine-6-phosphate deacetylase [Paenibacillus sp. MY03]OUS77776.1 N-acetylglucosamine-6-phosphate deacetylase [Paenibacillus sp. MY03]